MEIWYDSLTGNVRRFVHSVTQICAVPAHDLKASKDTPSSFVLVTYTFGQGAIPASTELFLQAHASLMRGVVASGSYHWGQDFARAADQIAERYGVPIVAKINKRGSQADIEAVAAWILGQG